MALSHSAADSWLHRFFLTLPKNTQREARYKAAAVHLLGKLCTSVQEEVNLPDGLRADAAGQLENGAWVVVECKDFESSASAHVDAVMQAASYADAIRQPVFIGPFDGSKSTLCDGQLSSGMSVLHLVAGRLNVGFLSVNHAGVVQLILRGQVLASSRDGLHSHFADHWGYVTRTGSKQEKQ